MVKILVQILQNTPILKFRIPPPPQWNVTGSPALIAAEYPPPVKFDRESSSDSFRIPPQWNLTGSPALIAAEYPPTQKKVGNLDLWDGEYSGTSDLDLWKKVGNLDFWDGKGGYSGTLDLDLGKKVRNLDFWDGGGYSGTSDLDLGKKVGNLDFWDGGGGVLWNFRFGLRKKSWKFRFLGWGGILELWIWT